MRGFHQRTMNGGSHCAALMGPCAKPPAEVLLSLKDLGARTRDCSHRRAGVGGPAPNLKAQQNFSPPTPHVGWAALLCVCGDRLPGGRGSKCGRRVRTQALFYLTNYVSIPDGWVCNHQQIQTEITLSSGKKQQKQNKKSPTL